MAKHYLLIILVVGSLVSCTQKAPFLNTNLSFEERTEDMLNRLTLQQKVDLVRYDSPEIKVAPLKEGGDSILIPAHNWWNECLHGVARAGEATVFPQAIGMAAMWDAPAMHRIASAISDEARAKHHDSAAQGKRGIYRGLTYWTPNINIFRDPRWGRGMETYGEDPHLTAELAIPFIKGLQGDDPRYLKIVATSKHFAVHSGPESTRHSANVVPSDYDMEETYLPHFERTVKEANVYSVMCAYQSLNGLPCCGNKFLEDKLRKEWGFEGYIVSDCWAVRDFYDPTAHHITESAEEAAALAVKAGTDLNCGNTYPHLVKAVEKGYITEKELDASVRRIILARMRLGMFDPLNKVPHSKIPLSVVNSPKHQNLALEAARKSIVLLRNNDNLLPLSKNLKRVAVIGPNADDLDVLLGNYNGFPINPKTPLQGIREKLPNTEIVYAVGCPLADSLPILKPIPAKYLYTDASLKTHGMNASYFNNTVQQGNPLLQRIDASIDFTWLHMPPHSTITHDAFSASWTGVLVPPTSGNYAIGGEGMNEYSISFDGKEICSSESEHSPHKQYQWCSLTAGKAYTLKVKYSNNDATYPCMRLLWDEPKGDLIQKAVETAQSADVVILCLGLSPQLEGEEMKVRVKGFEGGDRLAIDLPSTQRRLIEQLHKTGKPVVLVLLNGSAVALDKTAQALPAIVEAWYPGEAGGTAIADILWGDCNPSGRLPITFYKDINQLPPFDNYDMQGRTYRYFSGEPLYPFGHGLSYTSFSYAYTSVPDTLTAGNSLTVVVEVTNTGLRDGEEVVQLYLAHPNSPHRAPIRSLQGFRRIKLKAGETQTVSFTLSPQQMAVRDAQNIQLIEQGVLSLSVGGAQPSAQAIQNRQVIMKEIGINGRFFCQ